MKKFLLTSIPSVTLILFVLIMLSGKILIKPFGENDNVLESLQLISQDIESENWQEANENAEKLSNAWKIIVKRIQFSSERNQINLFNSDIARLRGAIIAKDKSNSLIELSGAYDHWNGLIK